MFLVDVIEQHLYPRAAVRRLAEADLTPALAVLHGPAASRDVELQRLLRTAGVNRDRWHGQPPKGD